MSLHLTISHRPDNQSGGLRNGQKINKSEGESLSRKCVSCVSCDQICRFISLSISAKVSTLVRICSAL
jgi:hypothetical protein